VLKAGETAEIADAADHDAAQEASDVSAERPSVVSAESFDI
jgi:hypothetical protein